MWRVIIGAFMLATTSVQAQDSRAELEREISRFQLYTACSPVYLLVEGLPPDAAEIGLTEDAISTTIRSRLRAARIYTAEMEGLRLYVNVNVVGPAFSYGLELDRVLLDSEHGTRGLATTWDRGGVGTHGKDPGYILQSLGQVIDIFIDEYLAVNESTCE